MNNKILVTKVELYLCKTYLEIGFAPILLTDHISIPKKIGDEFVKEMNLEYRRRSFGYIGDKDDIWNYFNERYKDRLSELGIDSYEKLLEEMRRNRTIYENRIR